MFSHTFTLNVCGNCGRTRKSIMYTLLITNQTGFCWSTTGSCQACYPCHQLLVPWHRCWLASLTSQPPLGTIFAHQLLGFLINRYPFQLYFVLLLFGVQSKLSFSGKCVFVGYTVAVTTEHGSDLFICLFILIPTVEISSLIWKLNGFDGSLFDLL